MNNAWNVKEDHFKTKKAWRKKRVEKRVYTTAVFEIGQSQKSKKVVKKRA